MYAPQPAPPPNVAPAPAPRRALAVLWTAIVFALLAVGIGGGWDAEWHRTQPFDGFFSPPHILIYSLTSIMLGVVYLLVRDPRTRDCFGPPIALPGIGVPLPGALAILVGGCGGLALAGPLDAAWHTALGLDETNWSLPHSMLGMSLALLTGGFIACRHALGRHLPARAPTWYLFGYLMVLAAGAFLGPIGDNATRETAQRAGSLGALANDDDYQHIVRIVTDADLTHTNPAFPWLAALWCGLAIGLLRTWDRRARYWLVVAVLVGLSIAGSAGDEAERLALADDPAASTALPLLTGVLVFALAWKLPGWWRYALLGLAVGLHAWSVWGGEHPPAYAIAALTAPVAAVAGGLLGVRVTGVLRAPTRRGVVGLVLVVLLAVPLLTGTVDLILRLTIP